MLPPLVEGESRLNDGRYRFLSRIGRGTFSTILRAIDLNTKRHVAIKFSTEPKFNPIAEREAQVLRQINALDTLDHSAVVQLLDTFVESEHFCIVLELLGEPIIDATQWGSWRQVPCETPRMLQHAGLHTIPKQKPVFVPIKKELGAIEALPLADIRAIAVHMCGALVLLHENGVIHADIKPENIVNRSLLAPSGCSVKVVDFGNCIDRENFQLYEDMDARDECGGYEVQTLTYRAPEVAAGMLLSPAMDMWSLGCVLMECATGEPLFQSLDAPSQFHQTASLLTQIECLVPNGGSIPTRCTRYRTTAPFSQGEMQHPALPQELTVELHARVANGHPERSSREWQDFCDFVTELLDVDPESRLSAKVALLHPFIQPFFPFRLIFAPSPPPVLTDVSVYQATSIDPSERKRKYSVGEGHKNQAPSRTSANGSSLKLALRIIKRGKLPQNPKQKHMKR